MDASKVLKEEFMPRVDMDNITVGQGIVIMEVAHHGMEIDEAVAKILAEATSTDPEFWLEKPEDG